VELGPSLACTSATRISGGMRHAARVCVVLIGVVVRRAEGDLSERAGTGPQSQTGTLTWNANGTLQQLQITDQINTANSHRTRAQLRRKL